MVRRSDSEDDSVTHGMTYNFTVTGISAEEIRKLGLLAEEKFLRDPSIGLLSSSKSNFRDLGQDFWLGETPRKSNPSLTLS